jgi:hypothetical protein
MHTLMHTFFVADGAETVLRPSGGKVVFAAHRSRQS